MKLIPLREIKLCLSEKLYLRVLVLETMINVLAEIIRMDIGEVVQMKKKNDCSYYSHMYYRDPMDTQFNISTISINNTFTKIQTIKVTDANGTKINGFLSNNLF